VKSPTIRPAHRLNLAQWNMANGTRQKTGILTQKTPILLSKFLLYRQGFTLSQKFAISH
jgi:hypothetical protein